MHVAARTRSQTTTNPFTFVPSAKTSSCNGRAFEIDGNSTGGSSGNFSADGVITYKRRKCARPSGENHLKTAKERHEMVRENAYEQDGDSRMDSSISLESENLLHGHWRNVLEHMVQSLGASEGGIQNCIRKALASRPLKFNEEFKMREASKRNLQAKESQISVGAWNSVKEHKGVMSDKSQNEPNVQTNIHVITERCQNVVHDVVASMEFASLCNLLCGNFQGIKFDGIFDFGLINSRMKTGAYEQCSGLLVSDIQQVFEKFQEIGLEMNLLAICLSNMARTSYRKQVGELVDGASGLWRHGEINRVGIGKKDFLDLDTAKRFPSHSSNGYCKPHQTGACALYKLSNCRQCGAAADGRHSLICDGCEAMYHITCINPTVEEMPTQSWYCASCSANRKQSPEPDSTKNQSGVIHTNCVVCDRHDSLETEKFRGENGIDNIFSSDCSVDADRPEPSRGSPKTRLCKLCGTGEDDNGNELFVCGHMHCPHKYYHFRCLTGVQIQSRNRCWYCPSCLCRSCFEDRDDDRIVLCDGCDDAYHIYCMVPPRTSIPKGKWFCIFCKVKFGVRERMERRNCVSRPGQQRKNDAGGAIGAAQSMDILLSAAEKLNSEEKSAAKRKKR